VAGGPDRAGKLLFANDGKCRPQSQAKECCVCARARVERGHQLRVSCCSKVHKFVTLIAHAVSLKLVLRGGREMILCSPKEMSGLLFLSDTLRVEDEKRGCRPQPLSPTRHPQLQHSLDAENAFCIERYKRVGKFLTGANELLLINNSKSDEVRGN